MAEGDAFRVTFTVPGHPRGKGRPRTAVIGGHARVFTDSKTRAEEGAIRVIAAAAMQGRLPYEGPIVLRLCAYQQIPPSWSNRKRAAAEAGQVVPVGQPDLDNFVKMTDALNGIVWRDDSQVVSAIVHKRYSERPRLSLDIRAAQISKVLE
jgi:Holliday junction resolvase RusA-like endonuclease